MATHSARRTLTGTGQYIQLKVPNTKIGGVVVLALAGTYVGQVQVESRDLDGAWNADMIDEDSGVALDGTYTDQCEADAEVMCAGVFAAAEDEIRVHLSAYTSGEVDVQVTIIQDLD